jgi:hypothetical protein
MSKKYFATLIAVTAVLAVIGFVISWSSADAPSTRVVVAGTPGGGVKVPGTNGKMTAFENGVYQIEPSGFGVSRPVREIGLPDEETAAEMRQNPGFRGRRKAARDKRLAEERKAKGLPPMTEEEKAVREINDLNVKALKKVVPGKGAGESEKFVDPLLANQLAPEAPEAMPTPALSFNGATAADNASVGIGGLAPPDANGDVGLNHYVSSVNLTLKFFNKSGTVVAGPIRTSDLWASLPADDICRTENDGDPIVLYDQLADRWHISQFAVPSITTNNQCVAVSTTGDPTGSYYVWSYQYPGQIFNDYPKVGVWNDAYHMTFNQFNNAGSLFLGMGFLSQDRSKALAGDPTASVVYTNIATIDPDAGGGLPLDIEGFVPPPANMPVVIGEWRANEFGDPTDAIRFYRWVPNFVSPGLSTVTVLPDLPVAAFDGRNPDGRTDIEQSGGSSLDAVADRLMHRLVYRNMGTVDSPVNSIVGSFTVNTSGINPAPVPTPTPGTGAALYDAGIRWFELRRNGDSFSVYDQGTHADSGGTAGLRLNNWMSSISQDNQGNLALGFSQSGPSQNADIKVAGRTNNVGGVGVMNEGEALFHDAAGSQTGSSRWGDYSMMSVDPVDDCTFWYTQEYFNSTSSVGWATRVMSFKFPSCTAVPKGTISGTITSCSSGLPVDDANVIATGGFHRLTISNGTYSMSVTPGNYTVDANKAPGFVSSAPVNVNVVNGGNSTANICLNGVAVLAPGTLTVVTESCGLPNNLADPGETMTVSLPIVNNGGGSTTNLIAKLRNTGGVINAGPSQNYGSLAPSGGTASRDFTFRVQPLLSCGSTITLTWDLFDGTTNLGTIQRTLTSGTQILNLDQNFDGVTPPALPVGWTQTQDNGILINWVTTASNPSSPPNAAFANEPTSVSLSSLVTPNVNVTSASARLTFRNNFNTESGFDGMVLEMRTGAGAFQDILVAGGTFLSNGYNDTLSTEFSNPLPGRDAWSGSSNGYVTTEVQLPASANGQSVQFRWRMGTDSSETVPSGGVRLDNIQVFGGSACNGPCAPSRPVRADFDNDGRTDLSIFRPSNGDWWVAQSSGGLRALNWGLNGDIPFSGDFSGDGRADFGIFRGLPNDIYIDMYLLKTPLYDNEQFSWGLPGDLPFSGDYNGDGITDVALYRPSDNRFYIWHRGPVVQTRVLHFGLPGDIPLAMDINGDGVTELAVYRPVTGVWYFTDANNGSINTSSVQFGIATDIPVPADYDADGIDDVAVYRPSNGGWYIYYSNTLTFGFFQWGNSTDIPVPGDYDGDGRYDPAIYRNGAWWMLRSTLGPSVGFWGLATDKPIPASYVRPTP